MNKEFEKFINDFTPKLQYCKTAPQVIDLVDRYTFNHPCLYYASGHLCCFMDAPEISLKLLRKAISFGTILPNDYWDTQSSDCIGSSVVDLFTYFKIQQNETATKLIILGYSYLSNCIEIIGNNAFESFENRGRLFDMSGKSTYIISDALHTLSQIKIVYSIPDYLDASHGYMTHGFYNAANNVYKRASYLHEYLEDITVAGKSANIYSLEEIAEIGRQRHKELYLSFKKDVVNSKYNISKHELDNLFDSIQ